MKSQYRPSAQTVRLFTSIIVCSALRTIVGWIRYYFIDFLPTGGLLCRLVYAQLFVIKHRIGLLIVAVIGRNYVVTSGE